MFLDVTFGQESTTFFSFPSSDCLLFQSRPFRPSFPHNTYGTTFWSSFVDAGPSPPRLKTGVDSRPLSRWRSPSDVPTETVHRVVCGIHPQERKSKIRKPTETSWASETGISPTGTTEQYDNSWSIKPFLCLRRRKLWWELITKPYRKNDTLKISTVYFHTRLTS